MTCVLRPPVTIFLGLGLGPGRCHSENPAFVSTSRSASATPNAATPGSDYDSLFDEEEPLEGLRQCRYNDDVYSNDAGQSIARAESLNRSTQSTQFHPMPINLQPDPGSLTTVQYTQARSAPLASVAARRVPPIPGLFFDSSPSLLIPTDLAERIWVQCKEAYFPEGSDVNQIMLFERAATPATDSAILSTLPQAYSSAPDASLVSTDTPTPAVAISTVDKEIAPRTRLPAFLLELLDILSVLLQNHIPHDVYTLLFPQNSVSDYTSPETRRDRPRERAADSRARQVILNHYLPGEGITPHVDLLRRYGDGIIGVCLGSGCVMDFSRAEMLPGDASQDQAYRDAAGRESGATNDDWDKQREERQGLDSSKIDRCAQYAVYLPPRSVIILTKEARYAWTHGIGKATHDLVECEFDEGSPAEWIARGERISITYRWLLPGADVVGA